MGNCNPHPPGLPVRSLLDAGAVEQLLGAGASAAEGLSAMALRAEDSLLDDFGNYRLRSGQHASRWPAGALAGGRGRVSRHPAARIARALLAHGADPLEPTTLHADRGADSWRGSNLGSLAHAGGEDARAVVEHLSQQAAAGTLRLHTKRRVQQLLLAAAHLAHLPLLRYGVQGMQALLLAEQALQSAGLPAGEGHEGAGHSWRRSSNGKRLHAVLGAALNGCGAGESLDVLLSSGLPFEFGSSGSGSLLYWMARRPTWRPHMGRLLAAGAQLTLLDLLTAVGELSAESVRLLLACGRPPADTREPSSSDGLNCPIHRAIMAPLLVSAPEHAAYWLCHLPARSWRGIQAACSNPGGPRRFAPLAPPVQLPGGPRDPHRTARVPRGSSNS